MRPTLNSYQAKSLRLQSFLAHVNLFWFVPLMIGLMRGIGGYRIAEHDKIRQQMRHHFAANGQRPILFVANHLTLIDSLIIIWALFDLRHPLKSLKGFAWNVPEIANFGGSLPLRLLCYLGKCVYVARSGSLKSRQQTIAKLQFLLARGQSVCIFPEGGRSRSGRVSRDAVTYGVGQLIRMQPETKVFCVYLRGRDQNQYSNFPKRGEVFDLTIEPARLASDELGRRYDRDLSIQLVDHLQDLEERYFAVRQ